MIAAALLALAASQSPDWALPPIEYGKHVPTDAVAALTADLATGKATIARDGDSLALASILSALGVPASSQVTVFSRTSLQAKVISPRRPRALYFSDDVYVGYVPGGDLIEVTTVDGHEGLVFYSLDRRAERPEFRRETHRCLQCHATARSSGMPSHVLRSLHTDRRGEPEFGLGSVFMDPSTPYEKRWGGWYVTGDVGPMAHLGNQFARGPKGAVEPSAEPHPTLAGLCDTLPFPTNTSDVVALLVLEHQTHAQNALVQGSFEARKALDYQEVLNGMLNEPPGTPVKSSESRLDRAASKIVAALMHVNEVPLPGPIGKESPFVEGFHARAVRDADGRSLRDLDLESRLFRYSVSYAIDSPAFRGLPAPLKDRVWSGLHSALVKATRPDAPPAEAARAAATLAILKATRGAELPAHW